ncbi:MAG: transposase [Bacteroidales bacterium]|nr:transposase [Bacteroidales bacterium]
MPRANRYFIPGHIWHITHRCHKRDFLFKFKKDRICWMHWLFEAKKRFGVSVLNYIVTSNHIHLLLSDNTAEGKIPVFMQLVQGRTAQEYNNRTKRKGAFWEDRYHATAIASDEHIIQCMIYIHMNMVRAGVVNHPVKWEESGCYEIQHPKKRYAIIDYASLLKILNLDSMDQLQRAQKEWIKDALEQNDMQRNGKWTEAIAIGNVYFLEHFQQQLDIKAKSRRIKKNKEGYELSESEISYNVQFDPKTIF